MLVSEKVRKTCEIDEKLFLLTKNKRRNRSIIKEKLSKYSLWISPLLR